MEYDKINNLLLSEDNESEQLSKFVTTEYVRANSLLDTYSENKSKNTNVKVKFMRLF